MIANKKPWGHECIAYQNADVAIWHLFINQNAETSLHCHPNKKTGLVVLNGEAKVHFLTDTKDLGSCDKIMIRQGVFHKTQNIGDGVLELFEIETPVNKGDLVRIRDKYNRSQSYSIEEQIIIENQLYPWNRNGRHKYRTEPLRGKHINNIRIGLNRLYSPMYRYMKVHVFSDQVIYMITCGGVFSDDICVCGPGDTVLGSTLNILANEFELRAETEAVVIYK